ncbi:hypothetical protein BXZ70DRAFT_737947 [Cristinia sonorae]|uniref:C2H2-type domain-containing protein n=1 Tax=Cristinia sonorae TaxID=1940300 RepID=A0A8K0UTI6_9AGAR|nr:hypothetical protein BXZ70DRAFT_737947 [Cristinia sonorae]
MLQDFSWELGCRERYIALADLSAHCANVHYTILPACETCGKAFISEMYLKAHMQAKHPRAVTCPKCSKMFTEGGAMAMHQWIAHPGSRCEPCGKYVFQEDMAEHLLTTPGHPVCSQCNIGFVDTGALYDHMALVHPERCCSLCNMIFTTTEHLREHHRTTRRHPSCIHCNVGFSSDTLLIKHNTLMHSSSCSSMTVTSDGEDSDTTTLSSSRASSPRSHIFKLSLTPSSPTTSSSTRIKNSRSLQMVECKHPVCAPCDVGFEDEASYHAHVAKIHPPLRLIRY